MEKHCILFVDDELNVLNALERAFIAENDIKVFTAGTAQEGIKYLEQENIEIVVSDEKMPVVQGHKFLGYVKNRFPETIRIILTGYADVTAILEAINKGEVYRYLHKPWDNNELVLTIKKALEFHALQKKNKEMHNIILEQNKQLKLFNLDLENSVQERTAQLKKALLGLKQMLTAKNYLRQMIDLCVAMGSLIHKELAAHMLRVTEHVARFLDELSIAQEEKEKIINAASLHDIGLFHMPAAYFGSASGAFSTEEQRRIYSEHPLTGHWLVKTVKDLGETADIIIAHHERCDGTGFPEKKWGEKIPLGARVIRLADEFDELTVRCKMTGEKALEHMGLSKQWFDPELFPLFIKQTEKFLQSKNRLDFETTLANIKSGMALQEDIYMTNDMLLFAKGKLIDADALNKLAAFTPVVNTEKSIVVQYIQKETGV